ncbi:MAG: serine hydrolase domain-containing protein, partial [Bacteroidota bacterium]
MKPILSLGLLLCLSVFGWSQSPLQIAPVFERWNSSHPPQPGVAVAVIHQGEVILQRTAGHANLEYDRPLDSQSVFDLASLAKQFTGFAIARLIIEGKLEWEDSVSSYLPELPVLRQGIKLKHLTYHTSGLRDVGELFDLSNLAGNFTSAEAWQLLQWQQELNFAPGTEYDYSNTNYVLLALIVEKVSGIPFPDWCATHMFEPLGMKHSFANANPGAIIPNRAVAYHSQEEGFYFPQDNGMALIGSSAVYSNLEDMIKWVQALETESHFPAAFRLMKQTGTLDNGKEVGYGLGLGIGDFRGHLKIDHSGSTPAGFHTQMAIFPEQEIALVILSNWSEIDPVRDVAMEVLSQLLPQAESEAAAPTPSQAGVSEPLSPEWMEPYLGKFLFNGEMMVHIRQLPDGALQLQLGDRPPVPLFLIEGNQFSLPALSSTIQFAIPVDGKSQAGEVFANGQQQGTLKRIGAESIELVEPLDLAG